MLNGKKKGKGNLLKTVKMKKGKLMKTVKMKKVNAHNSMKTRKDFYQFLEWETATIKTLHQMF